MNPSISTKRPNLTEADLAVCVSAKLDAGKVDKARLLSAVNAERGQAVCIVASTATAGKYQQRKLAGPLTSRDEYSAATFEEGQGPGALFGLLNSSLCAAEAASAKLTKRFPSLELAPVSVKAWPGSLGSWLAKFSPKSAGAGQPSNRAAKCAANAAKQAAKQAAKPAAPAPVPSIPAPVSQ